MAPDLFVVSYPTALFTETLAKNALKKVYAVDDSKFASTTPEAADIPQDVRVLQWMAYDDTNHPLSLARNRTVLSSCYTIRKMLIRKHFLQRLVAHHVAKHGSSTALAKGVPTSWDAEISFADELDEMWTDDLYELGLALDENETKPDDQKTWFILKPGMADRGMGIRIFVGKDGLQEILESFEEGEDDEDDETAVVASQLRHFVIQEYVKNPLLIDPRVVSIDGSSTPDKLEPRKFHLRAYCVASGALTLYLSPHILALFSAKPYTVPSLDESIDLSIHLTNTALQPNEPSTMTDCVRLLSELPLPEGITYLSLVDQTRVLLADVFSAALHGGAAHFQALPNAFELFGVDLLVREDGHVYILEINAEPAVHLTGERLSWTLQGMFDGVAKVCVVPFFGDAEREHEWAVGDERHGLIKCLEAQVRSQGAW
ncbi:TTL-domain-containing protein [Auriculariales sp. MPI-PUGE-AT-0066]|nr:TTL-domain-containing protein [Auriculariales sp. MPI-PUGE-AT-0066]